MSLLEQKKGADTERHFNVDEYVFALIQPSFKSIWTLLGSAEPILATARQRQVTPWTGCQIFTESLFNLQSMLLNYWRKRTFPENTHMHDENMPILWKKDQAGI